MKIAAVLKFSTLDYPGKLSAVVFCQGCSLRCKYCHNKGFLDAKIPGRVQFEDLISFLSTRKNMLEAVVFSGGEPLMQANLRDSIMAVKDLGFLVGLHTAGTYPEEFVNIITMVDWVGLDIKTSFNNYVKITQVENSGSAAKISLQKLLASNINYELRTTHDPRNISQTDMIDIAKTLREYGATKWIIQECIIRDNPEPQRLLMPSREMIAEIAQYIKVELRYG